MSNQLYGMLMFILAFALVCISIFQKKLSIKMEKIMRYGIAAVILVITIIYFFWRVV